MKWLFKLNIIKIICFRGRTRAQVGQ